LAKQTKSDGSAAWAALPPAEKLDRLIRSDGPGCQRAAYEHQRERILLATGKTAVAKESPDDQQRIQREADKWAQRLEGECVEQADWVTLAGCNAATTPHAIGPESVRHHRRMLKNKKRAAARLRAGQLTRKQRAWLLNDAKRQDTFERVRERLAAATAKPTSAPPIPHERARRKRRARGKWLAEAMLLVRDHPEMSDASIAKHVHINKSQLSRSSEYRTSRALARGCDVPRGFMKTGKDGTRDVEAEAPEPDE